MSTIKLYVPERSMEHVQEGRSHIVVERYFNVSHFVFLSKQQWSVLSVKTEPPDDS